MKKIILFFLALLLSCPASALTAKDIITKSDNLMRGNSSIGTMTMTVKTPNWQRTLKFKGWSKGTDKMLVIITYPKKEAGTASLKVGTDMWNYLPKINRTIKIPPSMMLQSWMGSDFTNDDIVKESSIIQDYNHTLLKEETINGDNCYKIQAIPKPNAAVIWGKIIYFCRKSDFVPVREEYYSDKGQMIKLMNLSKIKFMHDRNYPCLWTMQTLNQPGHSTIMQIEDTKFNVPVADSVFSLQNLGK